MLVVYALLIVVVPAITFAGIFAWIADREVMRWFAEVDKGHGRTWHRGADGRLYTKPTGSGP